MFFAARSIPTAVARRTKATWATQGLWPAKPSGGKPAVASETLYKNVRFVEYSCTSVVVDYRASLTMKTFHFSFIIIHRLRKCIRTTNIS